MSAADDMPTRREFEALTEEVRGLRADLRDRYVVRETYDAQRESMGVRVGDLEKFVDWVRNGLLAFLAAAVVGAAIWLLLSQGGPS